MPAARYQHGAVFVGARLHISGGAVGGGRMVDDVSSIVVLDTAAGTWCTQSKPSEGDPPEKEWEHRWVILTSCLCAGGGCDRLWPCQGCSHALRQLAALAPEQQQPCSLGSAGKVEASDGALQVVGMSE